MLYRLTKQHQYEQEIRKSRFLAIATPVDNELQAQSFLHDNSQPKASHNCWAWRIGDNYRFYDDGEPGSTAGRPILQAIEGQSVDMVAVLVIRWFGGIKLGTGGLIRAYGGTAAECLRVANKEKILDLVSLAMFCPYPLIDILQARLLNPINATIENANYDNNGVHWQITITKDKLATLKSEYTDLTSGQGELKII